MQLEEIVGRRIREARERTGMTQADLGRELGPLLGKPWSRQAMSAAEKGGRSFNVSELVAIATVLGTTLTSLITPGPETVGDDEPLTFPSGKVITTQELIETVLSLPREAGAERDQAVETLTELAGEVVDAHREVIAAAEGLGRASDTTARLMSQVMALVKASLTEEIAERSREG